MDEPRPSLEELMSVVGADRARHTPEEVAAAEQELRARLQAQEDKLLKGIRRAGAVAAAIGLLTGTWPLFGLAADFGSGHGMVGTDPLLVAVLVVQAAVGFLLFAAGLAFRRRKDWGRKVIHAIAWVAVAYCVVLGLAWIVSVPRMMGFTAEAVGFGVFGIGIAGVWLLMVWKIKTYFASAAVRRACWHPDGSAGG